MKCVWFGLFNIWILPGYPSPERPIGGTVLLLTLFFSGLRNRGEYESQCKGSDFRRNLCCKTYKGVKKKRIFFGDLKISRNFAVFLKHKILFYYLTHNTKMKKLFLSFAVLAGFAMVSCGNKAENAEAAEAQDTVAAVEEVAVVEEVVDSAAAAADTVAAAATEVATEAAAQ